ncbi:MAG: TIGR03668 family PPOX class F420-dependent oxidoreductase [Actinomycetota bacterium]|nr:TIGR03668 family PPOX class F420-dependent oxidoreductase [Actinomycetota bacterium]
MQRRLAEARVARLATVRPDGRPHLVPITFALATDRVVSAVDHKPKSTTDLQRLKNIAANSSVSVLVDHYQEDWSGLWWVRADGRGTIVEAGPDRERAISLLRDKYAHYREDPPHGPAIVVDIERWSSWSA